jgi:hypothetical protein
MRLGKDSCRWVFLTAAHVITAMDGRFLYRLRFATSQLPLVTEFEVELNPKTDFTGKKLRHDLVLIAFVAPCPSNPDIQPFEVAACEAGKCAIRKISIPGNDAPLPRRSTDLKEQAGVLSGSSYSGIYSFSLSDDVFLSGDSGTAIFITDRGKRKIAGCFVATSKPPDLAGERPHGSIGICHGGKEDLEWVDKNLSTRPFKYTVRRDTKASFPSSAVYGRD